MGDVYQLKFVGRYMVVTNTPDTTREALVKNGRDWTGRIVSYRAHLSTGLHSLFMTSDLPYLTRMRKTFSKALAACGLQGSGVEELSMKAVGEFLEGLEAKVGKTLDLRDDLNNVGNRMVATLVRISNI